MAALKIARRVLPLFAFLLSRLSLLGVVSEKVPEVKTSANSHLQEAEKLSEAKQYLQAIDEYKLSLEDDPENEVAFFGLALAQTQMGQGSEAIQNYQAALKINPKLWEAEVNLGMLLLKQQNISDALAHFSKAQTLNPKDFRCHYTTAKTLELLDRPSEAEAGYLRALDLAKEDPEKFEVHASLGSIYSKKKAWAEAERHLLAAHECQRGDVTVDLELAQLYYEIRQADKALEYLKSVNQPKDPEIHELMGRILLERKDYVAAIKSFDNAMKYQPDPRRRENLSFDMAQLCQQLGRTEEAITILSDISKTSIDPKLHFTLGSLYLHGRQFELAEKEFLRALELKADCEECYSNLGSVFLLEEKYPEAVTALTRFKNLRPEIAGTFFYLGIAYDKLNDPKNAWMHYQRFLELDQGKTDKQAFQAKERMKVLEKRIKKR